MKLLKHKALVRTMDLFCTNNLFDPIKIKKPELQDELKNLIDNLVRQRLPIVVNFVNQFKEDKEYLSWLFSMGYSHLKEGRKFTFLCTCENQFDIKAVNKKLKQKAVK